MRVSRRDFIKWSAAAGTWVYVSGVAGGRFIEKALAMTTPSLDPTAIPKYATPVLIPPVMPRAGIITGKGKPVDYYEISVKQFQEQILPAGLPKTTVWGYGPVAAAGKGAPMIHNAPSLTIEAQHKRAVRVKWINDLKRPDGTFLPHLLPVDQTLHWANPGGGVSGRDTRPDFTGMPTPGTYEGPVPMCTHLHGAVGVGDESDGYPEAWYLPDATDIPQDYAKTGTWYDFFGAKANAAFGVTWGPGYSVFQYPNHNRASTIWYHDHTLGLTRTNVYAGPAGFYIVRGGPDDVVLDKRTALPAVLPGPAPKENDKFPSNKVYYEVPLAIQDRAFNADGSLFYADSREYFDGATAIDPGYVPATDVSPIWNPEFFGNTIMVNGNTWPFLNVEQRRYRFRMLNGCQSRTLILDFSNIPGVEVWQIGNEGGYLAAPVNLTTVNGNQLLMTLAERADLIFDFTNVPIGNHVLGNLGPDGPFSGGQIGVDFDPADPTTTGQVLEFRVGPVLAPDPTTPPAFLTLPAIAPAPVPTVTRKLALLEMMSMSGWDGPVAAMLGTVDAAGNPMHHMWMDQVTEDPAVGVTEIWELYNSTMDAHPIHIHEITFSVVNRETLVMDPDTGEVAVPFTPTGVVRPPEPYETGVKDTVVAYPGEVTRVQATFPRAGQYVWHCHIVEHEDNEMMRPYRIGPVQQGQPGT